jgi:hypothetical protein
MVRREDRFRHWLALAALTSLSTGCSIHTQNGLVFFGDWSLGVTHSTEKCRACRAGRCHGCGCSDCMNGGEQGGEMTEDSSGAIAAPQEPTPAQGNPPQAVHNRFHPVPTRPVFGNPTPNRDTTIEALPHEYSSTPRLRSVPRPQVDPEELKEEKEKAKEGDRKEQQWIPWRTFP